MYKQILVHIPTEWRAQPIIDAALSLAVVSGAHINAVAVGYGHTYAGSPGFQGRAAVAAMYDADRENALARAQSALHVFEVEARAMGVSHECRALVGFSADIASELGPMARVHDLSIVGQPNFELNTFDNRIPQEFLFQAGGPVLFIPTLFGGTFTAARIGICWDGSRAAARALRDALPLLTRAELVAVISVDDGRSTPAAASREQVVRYLDALGIPATLIVKQDNNSQAALLNSITHDRLDMLVMGGYGHSRLREIILGGVTREMFSSMTVPTLMSH